MFADPVVYWVWVGLLYWVWSVVDFVRGRLSSVDRKMWFMMGASMALVGFVGREWWFLLLLALAGIVVSFFSHRFFGSVVSSAVMWCFVGFGILGVPLLVLFLSGIVAFTVGVFFLFVGFGRKGYFLLERDYWGLAVVAGSWFLVVLWVGLL